jgi:hypothetical protein
MVEGVRRGRAGQRPYTTAAFPGIIAVLSDTTTCTGPFAAVWDAAAAVADRGALALECGDGQVLGLAVDVFETSGVGDVFTIGADGFAVRRG